MIEEPEVWGVQSISADGVLIRVAVKTAPQEQWAIGRELRQRIKARFDAEDIEVPYPEWVVRTGAGVQGMNPAPTPEPGPGEACAATARCLPASWRQARGGGPQPVPVRLGPWPHMNRGRPPQTRTRGDSEADRVV